MKKLKQLLVLFTLTILCSCEDNITYVGQAGNREVKYYVIDSCEYIGSLAGVNTDILTHKGNCKFCLNRKK